MRYFRRSRWVSRSIWGREGILPSFFAIPEKNCALISLTYRPVSRQITQDKWIGIDVLDRMERVRWCLGCDHRTSWWPQWTMWEGDRIVGSWQPRWLLDPLWFLTLQRMHQHTGTKIQNSHYWQSRASSLAIHSVQFLQKVARTFSYWNDGDWWNSNMGSNWKHFVITGLEEPWEHFKAAP